VGYAWSVALFAGAIAAVAFAHYRLRLDAVAAFWIAYILTRPLGASLGDYLSQARHAGGLGLGSTVTSFIFLGAILVVVTFLSITRKDVTELAAHHAPSHAQVLVVAHRTAATPRLLEAIQARVGHGPVRFHLLVPNPAEHAEVTDGERRHRHQEGEQVLALALPLIEEASGGDTEGSVSTRHDPMDAIEEALHDGEFHEIILSTLPRSVSRWLHADLPRRVAALGLPVTTVVAQERAA
jgi:hypothetical protein